MRKSKKTPVEIEATNGTRFRLLPNKLVEVITAKRLRAIADGHEISLKVTQKEFNDTAYFAFRDTIRLGLKSLLPVGNRRRTSVFEGYEGVRNNTPNHLSSRREYTLSETNGCIQLGCCRFTRSASTKLRRWALG